MIGVQASGLKKIGIGDGEKGDGEGGDKGEGKD